MPPHPLVSIPRTAHVRANEHFHTYVMVDDDSGLSTLMHPVNNYLRVHLKWIFSLAFLENVTITIIHNCFIVL